MTLIYILCHILGAFSYILLSFNRYGTAIDQANSLLEYYRLTRNTYIKNVISQRSLMEFIYKLVVLQRPTKAQPSLLVNPSPQVGPSHAPVPAPKYCRDIDTKDVPGLAPRDKDMREIWNKLCEVFKGRISFPVNQLGDGGKFYLKLIVTNLALVYLGVKSFS
jgi:hypothetical protein